MSTQHPNVLYVGDAERGHAFLTSVESHGWWVYIPQDTLQALGMYVAYWPDIIVINADSQPDTATEVYHHLRSINAHPILILTRDLHWDVSANDGVFTAPTSISDYDLMDIICDLLQPMPQY